MDTIRTRTAIALAGLLILIAVVGLLFNGGQTSKILSAVGASIPASAIGGDATGAGGDTTGAGGAPAPAPTAGDAAAPAMFDASRTDLLVIKTGTLDLQVTAIPAAVTTATARVAALGGYLSGSLQSGEGSRTTASATYRIPAARWDDALATLRTMAKKVLDEKTESQDVTGQVVDLGARITNLQATEHALQAIMDRATKISDVLSVQAELTKVRGDIETASAERQHLTEQAAFSTLTVGFGLQPEPAVVVAKAKFDPQAEVDRASARMVDVLQGLATAGIWFGIVWLPIILSLGFLAVVVAVAVRWGRRRVDPPGRGPQAPPPPPFDVVEPLAG